MLAQHLAAGLQHAFEQQPGGLEVSLVLQQDRQVVEASDGFRVALAPYFAAELQHPLGLLPSGLQIVLCPEQERQVLEAVDREGMTLAQHLAADGERLPGQVRGLAD